MGVGRILCQPSGDSVAYFLGFEYDLRVSPKGFHAGSLGPTIMMMRAGIFRRGTSRVCGIFLFYCVNVRCCDWCNKEADWPLARQSKIKRENQMRILGSRRVEPEESPARWKESSTCKRGQSHRLPDLYKKRWMQESWDSSQVLRK